MYRPPKPNIVLVRNFLSEMYTKYDRFLILSDFNVHICCGNDMLSSEFINLIESFDLLQWVKSPTHKLGHILDLILTHNLQVDDVNVCETNFSDHMPILFKTFIDIQPVYLEDSLCWSRRISSTSNVEFSASFKTKSNISTLETPLQYLNIDDHWILLKSTCEEILDSIAPLRPTSHKSKINPWLNENTHVPRRQCRQAERRWKKSKLQVHCDILRDSLFSYHKMVRNAKKYFLL